MMVKVRFKTTAAGPRGVFMAGSEAWIDEAEADTMAAAGAVDIVEREKQPEPESPAAPVVESAAIEPATERAVMPTAKPRKPGRPKSKGK